VELTDLIHGFGAKVFAQISPGFGRQGHNWYGKTRYSASPAAITLEAAQAPVPAFKDIPAFRDFLKKFTETPREMTVEEIKNEEKEFVRSVWLAMCAGFDGAEIHAPHGYLLHQFLSPLTNKRTDEYGGSLENRMRFFVELAEMVKAMCGEFPVGVRISAEEHIPGGLTIDDMKIVAKELEKVGINYINLSDGGGFGDPKGGFGDLALTREILGHSAEIKKAVKIPVVAPVWTGDPKEAENAIKDGKVDIIEMARQALVDPETPNKIKAGRTNEIVKCTRCNICPNKQYALRGGICCPLNPKLGYEKYTTEYLLPARPKAAPVLTWGQRHLPPEPPPP
jgi:2,4-dienoyl-CoA reductase-like NADH-dependent reductase (Old Yellow Enzyme family)